MTEIDVAAVRERRERAISSGRGKADLLTKDLPALGEALEASVPCSAYEAMGRDRDSWQQAAEREGLARQRVEAERDGLVEDLEWERGQRAFMHKVWQERLGDERIGAHVRLNRRLAELADERDDLRRQLEICLKNLTLAEGS